MHQSQICMQPHRSWTFRRLVTRGLQAYWRVKRGIMIAAEACVVDEDGRVLLIKGSENEDWRLPIGVVRQGEALEATLKRLLRDEAGVELTAKPALWRIVSGGEGAPYDRIGFYIVRNWRWASGAPWPLSAFFPVDELSLNAGGSDAKRLLEALGASPPA